jgi:RHS repeat-associated protein
VIVDDAGVPKERIKYSGVLSGGGVPICMSLADYNADGVVDATDASNFSTDYFTPDDRADVNFDGQIDGDDYGLYFAEYSGTEAGGRAVLSRASVANRIGYAGYQWDPSITGSGVNTGKYHVRNRVLNSELGRWTRRDPLGYIDSSNLLEYAETNPIINTDSSGLVACPCDISGLLQDPAVKEAWDAVTACYGREPKISCHDWVSGGFALPGGNIWVGCRPSPDIVRHELRHAWQFCKYSINPLSICEELMCREVDAYEYAGQCSDSSSCCRRACGSVNTWAGGICNLFDDCMTKCTSMASSGKCKDGHYKPGPVKKLPYSSVVSRSQSPTLIEPWR